MSLDMRGLSTFIADIRKAATSKEAEQQRIDKELGKIRNKFKEGGKLSGYDRKKYICKLLYMYMLGYEIDFGHMEAINLLSADKYSEKHIGYLAVTLLINENHQLSTLITNSVKSDLLATHKEHFQCLALTTIANIGGKDFAEALGQDVQKILLAPHTKQVTRKKAALALLRLFQKYAEFMSITPDPVVDLLGSIDLGVVNCVASLVLGVLRNCEASARSEWGGCVKKVVRVLAKIVISKDYTQDYVYYGVPAPWLQIKLFQILQFFPMPGDGSLNNQISSVLNKIITASERLRSLDKSKTPSRNNAVNSVLVEAINLCIHYDQDRDLLTMSANILGRFLTETKDANLRYLGLASMSRLARCQEGDAMEHIRKNQQTILLALKDADVSIRRRALDLLFTMCDKDNAGEIVGELMDYLTTADFSVREDLVLKIAILSEKFAVDYTWYLDVVMNIITQAGDFVTEDVFNRMIHIIVNHEEVQKHSADTVFRMVVNSAAHEMAVQVAGYVLGEFGYLIADDSGSGAMDQFNGLHKKFYLVSEKTQASLLNTYVKFYNMYDDEGLRAKIRSLLNDHKQSMNEEMQQRATEYSVLIGGVSEETVNTVLENMPSKPKEGAETTEVPQSALEEEEAPAPTGGAAPVLESVVDAQQAAPTPPQPQPAQNNFLDDIFGGGAPAATPTPQPAQPDAPTPQPAAPAPQPAAPAPASNGFDDFFGTPAAPAGGAGAAAVATVRPPTAEQLQAMSGHYKQLLSGTQGLLFEDDVIQIGLQVAVHAFTARCVFVWRNKTQQDITSVTTNWTHTPAGLKITGNSPSRLAAGEKFQQSVNMECQRIFEAVPKMSVRFQTGTTFVEFEMPIPVTPLRFVEPLKVADKAAFLELWRTTTAAGSTADGKPPTNIIHTLSPINVDATQNSLSQALRFWVLRAVDDNQANMVGCGRFVSKEASQPFVINVENNLQASAIRLTVRTPSAELLAAATPPLKVILDDKEAA